MLIDRHLDTSPSAGPSGDWWPPVAAARSVSATVVAVVAGEVMVAPLRSGFANKDEADPQWTQPHAHLLASLMAPTQRPHRQRIAAQGADGGAVQAVGGRSEAVRQPR